MSEPSAHRVQSECTYGNTLYPNPCGCSEPNCTLITLHLMAPDGPEVAECRECGAFWVHVEARDWHDGSPLHKWRRRT